jgi:hypothetical protein
MATSTSVKRGVLFTAPNNEIEDSKQFSDHIASSAVTLKRDGKNKGHVKMTISLSVSNAKLVTNFDPKKVEKNQIYFELENGSLDVPRETLDFTFAGKSNPGSQLRDVNFELGGKSGGGKVGGPGL